MSNHVEIRDTRKGKWVWLHKQILFHEDITPSTLKVYAGIASFASNDKQSAYPSMQTIATKINIGRRTVIKCIKTLEDLGLVEVSRREGGNNTYYLLDPPADFGKVKAETKKKETKKEEEPKENWVKETLKWAEKRKGANFTNYGKQIGSLGRMDKAGYTQKEIKACWIMMENIEWWQDKGFDFKNVADTIPKKIDHIRKNVDEGGSNTFDHLINE